MDQSELDKITAAPGRTAKPNPERDRKVQEIKDRLSPGDIFTFSSDWMRYSEGESVPHPKAGKAAVFIDISVVKGNYRICFDIDGSESWIGLNNFHHWVIEGD